MKSFKHKHLFYLHLYMSSQHTLSLGYSIFSVPRKDRVGGGVALIAKDILSIKLRPTESYGSFEYMETEVRVAPSAPLLRFVVVYSPKPKANDNVASDIFIEDFSGLLDHLAFFT